MMVFDVIALHLNIFFQKHVLFTKLNNAQKQYENIQSETDK